MMGASRHPTPSARERIKLILLVISYQSYPRPFHQQLVLTFSLREPSSHRRHSCFTSSLTYQARTTTSQNTPTTSPWILPYASASRNNTSDTISSSQSAFSTTSSCKSSLSRSYPTAYTRTNVELLKMRPAALLCCLSALSTATLAAPSDDLRLLRISCESAVDVLNASLNTTGGMVCAMPRARPHSKLKGDRVL